MKIKLGMPQAPKLSIDKKKNQQCYTSYTNPTEDALLRDGEGLSQAPVANPWPLDLALPTAILQLLWSIQNSSFTY